MEDSLEILSHPPLSSSMPPLEYDSSHAYSYPNLRLKSLLLPHHQHDGNNYSLFENDVLGGSGGGMMIDGFIEKQTVHPHHTSTEFDGHDHHYIIHNQSHHQQHHHSNNQQYPSYYSTSLHTTTTIPSSTSTNHSPVIKYERSPMLHSSSPLLLTQNGPSMPSILLNNDHQHHHTESIRETKKDSMVYVPTGSIFEQINNSAVSLDHKLMKSESFSSLSFSSPSSSSISSLDCDSDSSSPSSPSHSSSSSSSKKSRRSKRKSSDGSKSKKRSKVMEESDHEQDDGSDNEKNLYLMEGMNGGEELNLSKEELSQLSAEERAEYKRLQRLQRNRASAQLSRERKKAYMRALEKQVKELSKLNSSLANQLSALTNENEVLKKKMGDHSTMDGKHRLEYSSSSEELTSPPLSPESARDADSDDSDSRRKKKSSDQRSHRPSGSKQLY